MTSIGINSNVSSLRAQRQLAGASDLLSSIFERLSSGQRINRAGDDAAGLAVASDLSVDRRVLQQGMRNLNDGLSLLHIADAAIEALSGIVIRLQELAEQGANGAYNSRQQSLLDEEAAALSAEYLRIARGTEFNGRRLLDASFGTLRLQLGYGADGGIAGGLGGNIGTGTFTEGTSYTAEEFESQEIALGDLNSDGILDLVTAGANASSEAFTTVRLGLGGGAFGTAVSYDEQRMDSYGLDLADVNNDGVLDIVTSGSNGGAWAGGWATARLGRGDGTFGTAVSYAAEDEMSFAVTLGDLNGDGKMDLVTAGETYAGSSALTVRLGQGDGTFGGATSYGETATTLRGVALDDVNGDGMMDVIAVGAGKAFVRFGRGDGSFGAAASYTMAGTNTNSVAVRDLNGDALLDLVTTGSGGGLGQTAVALGQGSGTFGSAVSYASEGGSSFALALGDLNGDGVLDLATAGSFGSDGYATVRLGRGDGTFGAALSFLTEERQSRGISLGDLNADGVLDMTTSGWDDSTAGRSSVRLGNTTSGTSALLPFDLTTMAGARQALPLFQQKLAQLTAQRGQIGAFMARLGSAISVSDSSVGNYASAESRIMDVDVAAESADLVRAQIRQQAGAAMLAHNNLQPALALQLLQ